MHNRDKYAGKMFDCLPPTKLVQKGQKGLTYVRQALLPIF